MGVLHVEESGERRSFRVSRGRLTVGSGEDAKLRLASPDVAALHAEIRIADDRLTVTPMPGVKAPLVDGAPVEGGPADVASGQRLEIGGATIRWQPEGADEPAEPARSAAAGGGATAGAAGGAGSSARTSGASGGASPRARSRTASRVGSRSPSSAGGGSGAGRPRARRHGAPARRGLPSWAVAVAILAGVGLVGFLAVRSFSEGLEGAERSSSLVHLRRAGELLDQGNAPAAEEHLEKVATEGLDAAELERRDELLARIEELHAAERARAHEARGERWFAYKLEAYDDVYLGGEPEPHVVRVFLDRCREFRERWPDHPRIDWIERHERRFAGFPGLEDEPGRDYYEWKAHVLTDTRPRDYETALELLRDYASRASKLDRGAVEDRIAELEAERETYHTEQLAVAEEEWESGNSGLAFVWLVHSILHLGDERMENEAAEILVAFDDAAALLRGYEADRPDEFAELLENDVVATFARQHDIP